MAVKEIVTKAAPNPGLLRGWAESLAASRAEAAQADSSRIQPEKGKNFAARTIHRFSRQERDTRAIGRLAAMLLHPANPSRVVHTVPYELSLPDDPTIHATTTKIDTVAAVTADRAVAYTKGGTKMRVLASLHETYAGAAEEGEAIFRADHRRTRHLALTVFSDGERVRHEVPLAGTRLDGDLLRGLPDDQRHELAKLARIVTYVGRPVRQPGAKRRWIPFHAPQRKAA